MIENLMERTMCFVFLLDPVRRSPGWFMIELPIVVEQS